MKRPRLFTAKEAAAMLGISGAAFDSYVRRYPVPVVRVNGLRRFTKDVVEAIRRHREDRGLE